MRHGSVRLSLVALLFLSLWTGYSYSQRVRPLENVLIETQKPYENVIQAVTAQGGRITYEYQYVNGVAAEIPGEAFGIIRSVSGVTAVYKDEGIATPMSVGTSRPKNSLPVATESTTSMSRVTAKDLAKIALTSPGAYSVNNHDTNIEKLHALELTGRGTTVAVIDSGVRSGFKLIQDAVVGGADFVDDGAPGPAADGQADWKQSSNDGHGTFVAGLIAGNGTFRVNRAMEQALLRYAPGALVDGNLPIIGTAPEAKIYVVRIFGETGAKVSDVIEAIDHVIAQRDLYFASGGRDGFKIDVANLSFGISTLAAGRTLLDEAVDRMLDAGIVPVVSVGDSGPSTLTNLNPATSRSALTVGATSPAVNERILYEVQYATQFPREYYPGIGADIRPYPNTEVQWSSSRGPSADGRLDPDVVATGVGNISQGYCPDLILEACFKKLTIGSGTSFSAPIVSGIAAVLRQAFPQATARQIQNAIIESGQINKTASHFDVLDRGHGVPDAELAFNLLKAGSVSNDLPPLPPIETFVKANIEANTNLVVQTATYGKSFPNMKPGQRAEILYDVPLYARSVRIRVHHVAMKGPQNKFYNGDRLFLYVHSARTSVGGAADYRVNEALLRNGADTTFVVDNPDKGVMRITLNPDTQNAGEVDAEVEVNTELSPFGNPTLITGTVKNAESKLYTVDVAPNTPEISFLLRWGRDWSHYPTSDVDLVVCAPSIPSIVDCRSLGNKKGATLAAPERVTIPSPGAGKWTVVVHGFNVPLGLEEQFTIEIRQ